MDKKKVKPRIKIAMVASIAMLVMIGPSIVGAAKEALNTYIPSLGSTIKIDSTIYSLKKPITKSVDSRIVTVSDIYYNQESEFLMVEVEGNGQLPKDKAKLTINNKKLKSYESSVGKVEYMDRNISWMGTYFFKYHRPYNEKEIKFSMILDNDSKLDFNCKLNKAKSVEDISELGPTTTNKGITITAVVDEEKNKLSVNLLQHLDSNYVSLKYGAPYLDEYELEKHGENAVTLYDANNKEVKGRYDQGISGSEEKFIFDINGLKKPFKIVIPQVSATFFKGASSSQIIELPIPKNNDKVYINKEITLESKDKLVKDSNQKIKIISVEKEDDRYKVELKHYSEQNDITRLEHCIIVPVGKSTSPKAKDWFEGGLSGGAVGEDGEEVEFKLPYPDEDKLYVEIEGRNYMIKGPWEIAID
ncbi:hypothetical protein [Romboutsia sp.]|uniref:hypothetical protein n=1 Tax=Romboutsia sp. TaxID=1965302 RepID=UPI003F31F629